MGRKSKKQEKSGKKGKKTRNIKKIVIIASVCILLAMLLFFLLGVKVSFVLDNELNIRLDPLEANLFTSNSEPVSLKLTVKNDNFIQCRSSCEFRLIDLSKNDVIYSENKTMQHKEEWSGEFLLQPPGKGSGQLIYNFEVECRNIKSLVCLSEGKPKYKSSIITLNYRLSEEEKMLKDGLKPKLEMFSSAISELSAYSERNNLLIGNIDGSIGEKSQLIKAAESADKSINSIAADFEDLYSVWKSEGYSLLENLFGNSLFYSIPEINSSVSNVTDEYVKIAMIRNNNINLIDAAADLRINISEAAGFYNGELNDKNLMALKNTDDSSRVIIDSYGLLSNGTYHSENDVNGELDSAVKNLDDEVENYKNMSAEGLFFSIYSSALIAVKNSENFDFSPAPFCDSLRKSLAGIYKINNDSSSLRDVRYGWSIGNPELDSLLANTTLMLKSLALEETIGYINSSNLPEKEKLLGIAEDKFSGISVYSNMPVSDFNLAVMNDESEYITYTIPASDIISIALLDNSESVSFIEKNCRNYSFDKNQSMDFTARFMNMDFSGADGLRYSAEIPDVKPGSAEEISDNPPECCTFGECSYCSINKSIYPVLFVHGHEIRNTNDPENTMNDFSSIQEKMQDFGYINAGELNLKFSGSEPGIDGLWGLSGRPVTARSSFYYILSYGIGSYSVSVQKSERIENYAIRLKEMIELLKSKTGADKVDVVALSMGGLVVREYVSLFGSGSIHKIITINTPHHGISGNVKTLCSVLGSSKECDDMSEGSVFLSRLNSKSVPENLYVIRSVGCKMGNTTGDGIVTDESGYLAGAKNYVIHGNCTDSIGVSLHGSAIEPDVHPETFELLIEILNE
jgi:hypothetical protein